MFPQPDLDVKSSSFVKEFPEVNDVYLLKENGEPTARINVGRLDDSQYWASKTRIIGVVLLLSFLFFVMVLLGESKILEGVWSVIVDYLGQFMPKFELPKLW